VQVSFQLEFLVAHVLLHLVHLLLLGNHLVVLVIFHLGVKLSLLASEVDVFLQLLGVDSFLAVSIIAFSLFYLIELGSLVFDNGLPLIVLV